MYCRDRHWVEVGFNWAGAAQDAMCAYACIGSVNLCQGSFQDFSIEGADAYCRGAKI